MKKKLSHFKDPEKDIQTFKNWVNQLEETNGYSYDKLTLSTSLGKTQVYGINSDKTDRDTLLIFPGFRTTSLIWDLDQGLQQLAKHLRIFLIETNGQPNLSHGASPSIKSLDYGKWGAEVFDQLQIDTAHIAGASFGGLVCMKIALIIPEKIKTAYLLNPGCFRFVSLGFNNIYYNLLPLIKTSDKNIRKFLDKVVFCKPEHRLSPKGEDLLVEYLSLAIAQYKDRTEKPYYMGSQLDNVQVDTHLLVGDKDILIPPPKSIRNAKKHLKDKLKNVQLFENVAHGIECYPPCIDYIDRSIRGVDLGGAGQV